jgi:hypothetical protein
LTPSTKNKLLEAVSQGSSSAASDPASTQERPEKAAHIFKCPALVTPCEDFCLGNWITCPAARRILFANENQLIGIFAWQRPQ